MVLQARWGTLDLPECLELRAVRDRLVCWALEDSVVVRAQPVLLACRDLADLSDLKECLEHPAARESRDRRACRVQRVLRGQPQVAVPVRLYQVIPA